MRIILASGSPRRRELLTEMGIEHEIRLSGVDESTIIADHPRTFAIRAAYAKAQAVARDCEEGEWVLAADTVVTRRYMLYGKPADEAEATRMLRALSGQTHDVITGLAICRSGSMQAHLYAERTGVAFRELTDTEIAAYIDTGEPFDKAGAYGIQGHGGDLVDHIEGDYFNVVGLPCRALVTLINEAGLEIRPKLPQTPKRWLQD